MWQYVIKIEWVYFRFDWAEICTVCPDSKNLRTKESIKWFIYMGVYFEKYVNKFGTNDESGDTFLD